MSTSQLIVKPVENRRDLKKFIRFNYELYKNNPYAVPDLLEDLLDTFNPKKNAAYDFCRSQLFLAWRDGKIVGRVAAIINDRANETWNTKNVRFGWIDFIDDIEVSRALIDVVSEWGKQQGMTHIVGPLGFTDMDPEGMLVEGYDRLSTMSTIYNYPYYPEHIAQLGFEKEVGWVERLVTVPHAGHHAQDDKYFRVAKVVEKRLNLKTVKFRNLNDIKRGNYAHKIFDVINRSYAPLYGFSKLMERQIDSYAENYLRFIDMRLLTVIENEEGEVVAIGIGMGSLSHAIQKAKSKIFPFGWVPLLKALKCEKHRSEYLDLLLVGVVPEYQGKGVNAMLFADLIPIAQKMGFKWGETHCQLEDNDKSQDQWAYLECEIHKRRNCYKKKL
ncbi:MAG: N-acetyltransferase [Bacteroidales bacterium]|nr:N-acetyltransferase [Candidatus Physcousia equi]